MSEFKDYGKVILIDSNLFFVRRLSQALQSEGFEVVHCSETAFALTAVEWTMPVAILCATSFFSSEVYTIPSILQTDEKTRHIAVIAIGDDGQKSLLEAFRSGYDDYLERRMGAQAVASHLVEFLLNRTNRIKPGLKIGQSEMALSGSLGAVDLPNVIQTLGHTCQTGLLRVKSAGSNGIIFFNTGQIIHAENGPLIGDTAVMNILENCQVNGDGEYKFVPGCATPVVCTVHCKFEELMLDVLHSSDDKDLNCRKVEEFSHE